MVALSMKKKCDFINSHSDKCHFKTCISKKKKNQNASLINSHLGSATYKHALQKYSKFRSEWKKCYFKKLAL
jgi:hypothetical protein